MRSRGRLIGRYLAIPLLGAIVTAALVYDLAWSQSRNRRTEVRTAQALTYQSERAPAAGPRLAQGPSPQEILQKLTEATGGARFLPEEEDDEDPPIPEEIAPIDPDAPLDYTVPLRRPADEMVLESEDGLISLVARNASLQDVLTALAETQGLNLITQESVVGQINTTLNRVPFEDVLDVILSTGGFTWVRNRNVIQVTSVSDAQNLAPETQGRLVEVFQLDYVSATDVSGVVQTMLSPAGSVTVVESSDKDNRRTQEILVVQDLGGYVENIRNYIRRHDVPPRQVLIEAYILKIELGDDCRHGVNFDHLFRVANSNLFEIETQGFANPAASPGFIVNLSGGNLGAVVEMLESTTDAKTLASPKIRVLNGQTARIQVGEQLGFRVTTTTETSTTESVEFLDVGVVLEVTPRIGSDGTVIMRVKPEVSSGQVNPNTGLPEEETTELETDVMFHDNQAYVIGGLIQETDTDTRTKLPWLGDLKYVGHLFQRAEVVKQRSEVIVALLPRIMPFDPVTNNNLLEATERATTPLFHGALHEYPRPWEAQLPHVVKNPNFLRLPPTIEYSEHKEFRDFAPEPIPTPVDDVRSADFLIPTPLHIGPPPESVREQSGAPRTIRTSRITRLPATESARRSADRPRSPASGTQLR